MFELGMRLAFDKPTVIVKDDKTTYNFDTSPIEHVGYPRDLRFTKIVQLKEELAKKIVATYQASKTDPAAFSRRSTSAAFGLAFRRQFSATKGDPPSP
jgi:hypothetical protein